MDVLLDPANRAATLFDAIASKAAISPVQNQPSFRDCLQPRQSEPPARDPASDVSSRDKSSNSNLSSDSQVAEQSSTRTSETERLEQEPSSQDELSSVDEAAEDVEMTSESDTPEVVMAVVQVQLPATAETPIEELIVEVACVAEEPVGEEPTDSEPESTLALIPKEQGELVTNAEVQTPDLDPAASLDSQLVEAEIIAAEAEQLSVLDETAVEQQLKTSHQSTRQAKASELSKAEGEDQPLESELISEAQHDTQNTLKAETPPQLDEDSATASDELAPQSESQCRAEETPLVTTTIERPTESAAGDSAVKSSPEPAVSNATSGTEGPATNTIAKAPPAFLRGKQAQSTGAAAASEIDPAKFISRVAKAFQSAEQRGSEVRLRLHPSELGSLSIEVKVQEGVLTARVQAETSEARTALVENLPQLRERLAEQGIRIDQFDVDLMDHSDHQPQQSRDEQEGRPSAPSLVKRPAEPAASESRRNVSVQSRDSQGLNVIV